jgi:hypothetical protein
MDDSTKQDSDNDLEVEFTDLDGPDKLHKVPVGDNIQHRDIPRHIRVGMTVLTIAGTAGFLLLILVSLPRAPKQAAHSALSTSVMPLDVLVADGVVYASLQDR